MPPSSNSENTPILLPPADQSGKHSHLKYIFLALAFICAPLSVSINQADIDSNSFSTLGYGPFSGLIRILGAIFGGIFIWKLLRESKDSPPPQADRLTRILLSLLTLGIIITPFIICDIQPIVRERQAFRDYENTYDTIIGTGTRPKALTEFYNNFPADVYMPKWKTGSAVNKMSDRAVKYHLEYAPLQPNNDYKAGDESPLNKPEYFIVYVTHPDNEIKKFLNPPRNCSIENAIKLLQGTATSNTQMYPCTILGTNSVGSPIYGDTDWKSLNALPDKKYAFTMYGEDNIHIFEQYGDAENVSGGELSQLQAWQGIYRKFDNYDFDAR
ncbi:MAG: hypothetical protein V4702_03115 [Patescibacteria group bacterium]